MMRRRSLTFSLLGALLLSAAPPPAHAGSGFERFADTWSHVRDYSVAIAAYEALGSETDEHSYQYAYRKPAMSRLDVVTGTKSGATEVWNGGDAVTAYRRGLSFFKKHGHARDRDLTSLRGNGILMPNLGDLVACFTAHRDALSEKPGPTLGGEPTDEITLPYGGIVCPNDSDTDRSAVTLDVIDVSRKTGLVLSRTRYQNQTLVERWTMTDYKVNTGIGDGDLR